MYDSIRGFNKYRPNVENGIGIGKEAAKIVFDAMMRIRTKRNPASVGRRGKKYKNKNHPVK